MFKRNPHPLGWDDRELSFLIKQGLTLVNLYRAMGYRSEVVSPAFRERARKLGYKK